MNIFVTILLELSNILYCIYEMLILTGVSVLYIQKSDKEREEILKTIINSCNNYCKDVSIDIGWKCAEIITVTKIFYRKQLIPTVHYLTNDYFRYPILLIKDGEEIMCIKILNSSEIQEGEYDLLFYTDYSENDPKRNYTIISETGIKDIKSPIEHKCDINFIIFQLTHNDETFDINLKEPKNFLLKNNVLKYNFFRWYMKKVYNTDLSQDYSVNYMCQDMSTANLKSPFFIKFGDDGVTSFSSKKTIPIKNPTPLPELNESGVESVNESSDESIDESSDESGVESVDESSDESIDEVENNNESPTFCSRECVLKIRQNLNNINNEPNVIEEQNNNDDSLEYIEQVPEITEDTFSMDFSKNLISSIVKTEQQKLHQE